MCAWLKANRLSLLLIAAAFALIAFSVLYAERAPVRGYSFPPILNRQ